MHNNLGIVLAGQGATAAAVEHYRRALRIYDKLLAPNDPQLATALENYAATLRALNRDTEAAQIETRAKQVRAEKSTRFKKP